MRFVIKCPYCSTVILEILDESYANHNSMEQEKVCKKCRINLKKLKEAQDG